MVNPCSHRPLAQDIHRILWLQAIRTDRPDTARNVRPLELEQHLLVIHFKPRTTEPMKGVEIVAQDAYLASPTVLDTETTADEIRQIVEATADMDGRPVQPTGLAFARQVRVRHVRVAVKNSLEAWVACGVILVAYAVEPVTVHEFFRHGRPARVSSDRRPVLT